MSAQRLFERIDGGLSDWKRQFIKPMAAMSVRFSGKSLAHVGRAVSSALELVLESVAPAGTTWRGVMAKGTKRTRYAAHRPVTAAGLRPVETALASLRAMPPQAFELYLKDGSTEVLTPDTFAAWVGLTKTGQGTFVAKGGLLSFAVPLEQLESPSSLLTLGDQLMELLQAEAAWLGPAVWLAPHCLFNSASNELTDYAPSLIELFGVNPQLDAPHLYASRWPHSEVEPSHFSGLLAPSWSMWLDAKLAKTVKSFPGVYERRHRFTRYQLSETVPFEMTEETYAQWRAGWEALTAVHLRCKDTSATGRYFRGRLGAASHAQLLEGWRNENAAAASRATRAHAFAQQLRTLREAGSVEIVEVTKGARGVLEPSSLLWALVPALITLVASGQVDPSVAMVWLDYGEETAVWRTHFQRDQMAKDAAALAAAAGAPERAFSLLRDAFTDHRGKYVPPPPARKRELARDPRFKSLRTLPAWKKLVTVAET